MDTTPLTYRISSLLTARISENVNDSTATVFPIAATNSTSYTFFLYKHAG